MKLTLAICRDLGNFIGMREVVDTTGRTYYPIET